MRPAHVLLVTSLSLLLACSRREEPGAGRGAPSASAAATATWACPVAAELDRALAPFDGQRGPSIDQDLPEGEGAPLGEALVVAIAAGEIRVDGRAVPPGELPEALAQRALPPAIAIAVAPSEKALEPLRAIAEAAGDRPLFVAARAPGAIRVPLPAGVREAVARDPMAKPRFLAEGITRAVAQCPPAKAVFGELASLDPAGRNGALRARLPRAIDACGCKVEPELVELLRYASSGGGPVVGKRLRVAPEGAAVALGALDGAGLYAALPADGAVSLAP